MVEGGDRVRFTLEARAAVHVQHPAAREHLNGDEAIQTQIPGLVHLAHSARADGGDDFVRTESSASAEQHWVKGAGLSKPPFNTFIRS